MKMKTYEIDDRELNKIYKISETLDNFDVNRAVLSINTKTKEVKILYPRCGGEFVYEDDMVDFYENTTTKSTDNIIVAVFGREFYWKKVHKDFNKK